MKNKIESKIISQNGIFLIHIKNKRMNSYAYIVNQDECINLIYGKGYLFEIIGINRVSQGYENLHILNRSDIFNLVGTNCEADELKELLKADYIPNLVKLIK